MYAPDVMCPSSDLSAAVVLRLYCAPAAPEPLLFPNGVALLGHSIVDLHAQKTIGRVTCTHSCRRACAQPLLVSWRWNRCAACSNFCFGTDSLLLAGPPHLTSPHHPFAVAQAAHVIITRRFTKEELAAEGLPQDSAPAETIHATFKYAIGGSEAPVELDRFKGTFLFADEITTLTHALIHMPSNHWDAAYTLHYTVPILIHVIFR